MEKSTIPNSVISAKNLKVLAEDADFIRGRYKRVYEDCVESGRRLTRDKEICGHGYYGLWLKEQFGWSRQTADNLVHLYEMSQTKMPKFGKMNIPVSSIYMLAAPATSDAARAEVAARAKAGEKMSGKKVKEAIQKNAKPKTTKPKPAKSTKPAKATAAPPATTKPAAPAAKPAEQTTAPPAPSGWSPEAVDAARAIAAVLTRRPLEWKAGGDEETANVVIGEYKIFRYDNEDEEEENKFGAIYSAPNIVTKWGNFYDIGSGKNIEEVRRIAEEHWNNWETIAAPTAPSPTPDDAGVSSTGAGSEPVTLELKATVPAADSSTASSTDAVWSIKKYDKRGKHRIGEILTVGDRQFHIDPKPTEIKKHLDGYRVSLVMIPDDMKDHRLNFFVRTPGLRGEKANEDMLERARAFVREQAGLLPVDDMGEDDTLTSSTASESDPAPGAEQPLASSPASDNELGLDGKPLPPIVTTEDLERQRLATEDAASLVPPASDTDAAPSSVGQVTATVEVDDGLGIPKGLIRTRLPADRKPEEVK